MPTKAAFSAQTYRGPSQQTSPQQPIVAKHHRQRGSTAGKSFRGLRINKDSSLPTIMTSMISPKERAPSQTNFGRNRNIQSISSGNYVNINNLMDNQALTNNLVQQIKSRTNTVRNSSKTSMNLISLHSAQENNK